MEANQNGRELELDGGAICGGFAHDYEARIVPTADSPVIRTIEKSTGVRRERHLTVQVVTDTGERTMGFTCDDWHAELTPCVFTTPDRHVLGVRLQGCAYIVDVTTKKAEMLTITPLMAAASDTRRGVIFFADYTRVAAFNGTEFLWTSDRVSLDGISRLSCDNGIVHGIAEVGADRAVPFTIDAETGEVRGGFREWFPDWPGSV